MRDLNASVNEILAFLGAEVVHSKLLEAEVERLESELVTLKEKLDGKADTSNNPDGE